MNKTDEIEVMTNREVALEILANRAKNFSPKKIFEILREADEQYTNEGDSFVSDAEYDALRLLAESTFPTDPYFLGIGSSVRGDKIRLPYKMGSLDQVQVGELNNWLKSKNGFKRNFVITDKMDGVSVLLVYGDDGKLQIALTRGDGYQGQDITRHVVNIPSVPKKIGGCLSVRAEIIFSESTFKKIQDKVTRQDGTPFKNPRNAIAGILNHKTVNKIACENMTVFAYSIMGNDLIPLSKERQLKYLSIQGFTIVGYEKIHQSEMTENYLENKIVERKLKLDFAIDGIVVEFNNEDKRKELESDELNPAYAFKYKILDSDNIRTVIVKGVEWNMSKHGYAKPKIKLQPFDLQGVTISNTTGFNAKYIKDNNIGEGTTVKMTRSGDVIPYILEVISGTVADMPKNMDDYEWSENDVDLILKNKNTDEIKIKQLVSWATSMGIDGLKAGSVEKMFEFGYKTPSQLVLLPESLWVHIIGKNGSKIFKSIRTVLNPIELSKLMGSYPSFGVGIGVRKIKLLLDSNPTLSLKILDGKLTQVDVESADTFEEKSAVKVMEGYHQFMDFLKEIDGTYSIMTVKQTGTKFKDQTICFTGFRDKELQQRVEDEGGTVSSSVSKNTTLLVALDPHSQSGKVLRAEELGVKIMGKEEFEKLMPVPNMTKSVSLNDMGDSKDLGQFFEF